MNLNINVPKVMGFFLFGVPVQSQKLEQDGFGWITRGFARANHGPGSKVALEGDIYGTFKRDFTSQFFFPIGFGNTACFHFMELRMK